METLEVYGGLIGAAGAAVSALFALLSHKYAKRADKDLKKANDIAQQALMEASEANLIAKHSNQLGEEANAIAAGEADRSAEHALIAFRVVWNGEENSLVITNHGTDTAHQLAVLVDIDDLAPRFEHRLLLPGGEQLLIPLTEVAEHRADSERHPMDPSVAFSSDSFSETVRVRINFRTPAGLSQTTELLEVVAS